jgi:hypothetical protein
MMKGLWRMENWMAGRKRGENHRTGLINRKIESRQHQAGATGDSKERTQSK